ncbi:tRNA (adenosine(37)-N6)-threonylcarbamoyltransferase complex dimerization subunit type 1 TsaB [Halocynthiibacter styelae]|uniref:tRNA (Adenosine(37)-N6)-threonylcarbamoyltransferase complex dimerization subunit type 1 TsaB n=1 Tax=Halocynthiibacter styelae TaxID=2761955 RepID=A0A8J7IEC5_9RHOB|nr:tRNA (adenosine(37)-N6)-threonylcarbamoyltransferase complex dimerization subunit type 1 TsaB [Paenihalocynthiibacter styelae]MBI1494609.1 tRNA (adenosine(37)-N6)-threonylcarbamoyltransferase complex dimerization subunit type 1 TsaB [Paenihalocynthiibacter styelae]
MLTLGFDTSAAHVAAALLSGDEVLSVRGDLMAKGQAEHLMPMMEEMLAGAGKSWQHLDRIGVGVGPGNFTGIRIAVSAARGLALSLNIPAIGVSGFEVAAFSATMPFRALVNAPRDQVYCLESGQETSVLMPRVDLAETTSETFEFSTLSAEDIALRIARIAAVSEKTERPAPLYIRAADAAPPKDPLPRIIG